MATTARARRSRWTPVGYHHGNLREALIHGTLEIVRRAGPAEVTLRGVARAAGVSEAAPYHHFRDKNELLAAAAALSFDALHERLQAGLDSRPGDPRAALVALGVAWVGFALDQPGSFRLLFGAHVDNLARFGEVRAAGRRAKALVRAVVREFLEAASLREDPERLFRVFWAQVHGTAWLTLEREYGSSFGRGDALALAAVGLDRLLGGVAAAAR